MYSFQIDEATNQYTRDAAGNMIPISSTIDNVLCRLHDQTHVDDKFIIVGNFQSIMFRNKYENNNAANRYIEYITLPTVISGSYVIWKLPHEVNPGPIAMGTRPAVYFEFDPIGECVQPIDFATPGIRISNILQVVTVVTPDYSKIRFVVFANNSQGETHIYIPFAVVAGNWNPNRVIDYRVLVSGQAPTIIPYKVSCSAISVNKN